MSDLKALQAECDRFNKACPVGTAVTVKRDDGTLTPSKVRSPAEILGGHTAIGFFEGISGGYLLERARKA